MEPPLRRDRGDELSPSEFGLTARGSEATMKTLVRVPL
jgi:hypothetical protein